METTGSQLESYAELPRKPRPTLDTSLPSVRHIQGLIRQKTPVALRLLDGHVMEGVLLWQDADQLALDPGEGRTLTLVNRRAVAVLRSLT